jgi:hypothetical protein
MQFSFGPHNQPTWPLSRPRACPLSNKRVFHTNVRAVRGATWNRHYKFARPATSLDHTHPGPSTLEPRQFNSRGRFSKYGVRGVDVSTTLSRLARLPDPSFLVPAIRSSPLVRQLCGRGMASTDGLTKSRLKVHFVTCAPNPAPVRIRLVSIFDLL